MIPMFLIGTDTIVHNQSVANIHFIDSIKDASLGRDWPFILRDNRYRP